MSNLNNPFDFLLTDRDNPLSHGVHYVQLLLCLDVSGSTGVTTYADKSTTIYAAVLSGARKMIENLQRGPLSNRILLSVFTFGGTVSPVEQNQLLSALNIDQLFAKMPAPAGHTPMGECLQVALDSTDEFRRSHPSYRFNSPILALVTDGEANGDGKIYAQARERIQNLLGWGKKRQKLVFLPVGISHEKEPKAFACLKDMLAADPLASNGSGEVMMLGAGDDLSRFFRLVSSTTEAVSSTRGNGTFSGLDPRSISTANVFSGN